MRIFTVSDIHIDYKENFDWMIGLTEVDHQNDALILAGDISHRLDQIETTFRQFKRRFARVFYVPGNHDLWVYESSAKDSFEKLEMIDQLCDDCGIETSPAQIDDVTLVPLHSWYDFSFGEPGSRLRRGWSDFRYCKWPEGYNEFTLTEHFLSRNEEHLRDYGMPVITFSHFLPRLDVLPIMINLGSYVYAPILGTHRLEEQVRKINPQIHVFGHSHINVKKKKKGIRYVNNAYGYPSESHFASKKLVELKPKAP